MNGEAERNYRDHASGRRRAPATGDTEHEPWPAECLIALGLVGVLLVLLPVAAS